MGGRQDPVNRWFVSVSSLVALCTKHASRISRKLRTETGHSKIAPRSPLPSSSPSPKQLLTAISNKAIHFRHKKRREAKAKEEEEEDKGFGDGGLWQRTILMGEKCQPPEFSGVIYYDSSGKQLPELPPRSPRASPLPSFSFPMVKDEN